MLTKFAQNALERIWTTPNHNKRSPRARFEGFAVWAEFLFALGLLLVKKRWVGCAAWVERRPEPFFRSTSVITFFPELFFGLARAPSHGQAEHSQPSHGKA